LFGLSCFVKISFLFSATLTRCFLLYFVFFKVKWIKITLKKEIFRYNIFQSFLTFFSNFDKGSLFLNLNLSSLFFLPFLDLKFSSFFSNFATGKFFYQFSNRAKILFVKRFTAFAFQILSVRKVMSPLKVI
jgi:hypothetical protein